MENDNKTTEQPKPQPRKKSGPPLGRTGTIILGLYNVVSAMGLGWVLFKLFTVVPKPDEPVQVAAGCSCFAIQSYDQWLFALVAVAGALGSYVHSCTSFVDFSGNRALVRSWVWWYLLRVPIGVFLAIVVYFAVRGGLLAGSGDPSINEYGLAGIAALSGMFSKQAVDKLRQVFETLLGKGEDDKNARADKLADAAQGQGNPPEAGAAGSPDGRDP